MKVLRNGERECYCGDRENGTQTKDERRNREKGQKMPNITTLRENETERNR